MNAGLLALAIGALMVAALGCASSGGSFDLEAAGRAEKIEIMLDERGNLVEVEYHLHPDAVPEAVHAAMRNLHPGVRITGAERETLEGQVYWELAGMDRGFEVEAMFFPDGRLYEEEIQIPVERVPAAVRETIRRDWLGARVTAWEEIRNARREVYEYHVKFSEGARNYKALLSPSGEVLGVFREVVAEVEVPVRR